jgi:SH3 domain protein
VKNILLLLVLLTASSQSLSQQTQYIRDELHVPLRSGQGNQYRIVHKGLVSGTALTVLEQNEDKTYTKVRTSKGIEGWIQSQYLKDQPSSKYLLKLANQTISKLQKKNADTNKQLNSLSSQDQTLKQKLAELSKNNSLLANELKEIKAISANAIQINQDNQRLLEENQMLINKTEMLSTDNQRLIDKQESDSFLSGAFAVLIGVMITLLVPYLWPKKRTDWA